MKKSQASFSLGGLVLAVIAAVFFGGGKGGDPGASAGGQGTQVSSPEVSSPEAGNAGGSAARRDSKPQTPPASRSTSEAPAAGSDALPSSDSRVGFTSYRSWQSHFEKHGSEFGSIDADAYLARAKALRDAPTSRRVIEKTRGDGVITRFDRKLGDFIAFHKDKTIRTFFRPNDGERYFDRQARR